MRNTELSSYNYHIKSVQTISEQEIMNLQDAFLTTGFHTITLSSVEEGRTLITKFIAALNCYRSIACIKQNQYNLEGVFDIYKAIREYGEISNHSLFNFFLDQFNFDFLCIEMTYQLMQAPWMKDFLQHLIDFKVDQNIPIVCLAYRRAQRK